GPIADRVGAALGDGFAAIATGAGTVSKVVLPAVKSLVQYVGGSLVPVFRQVAQIFTGQVLPLLASLGKFLYGTVYPAVVGVATAVGSNLRPVLDQFG